MKLDGNHLITLGALDQQVRSLEKRISDLTVLAEEQKKDNVILMQFLSDFTKRRERWLKFMLGLPTVIGIGGVWYLIKFLNYFHDHIMDKIQ